MARLRHAKEQRERLLSGTLRKSRLSAVRAVVDPGTDIGIARSTQLEMSAA
jgi:hypothetical protein